MAGLAGWPDSLEDGIWPASEIRAHLASQTEPTEHGQAVLPNDFKLMPPCHLPGGFLVVSSFLLHTAHSLHLQKLLMAYSLTHIISVFAPASSNRP